MVFPPSHQQFRLKARIKTLSPTVLPGLKFCANYSLMVILIEIEITEMKLDIKVSKVQRSRIDTSSTTPRN